MRREKVTPSSYAVPDPFRAYVPAPWTTTVIEVGAQPPVSVKRTLKVTDVDGVAEAGLAVPSLRMG